MGGTGDRKRGQGIVRPAQQYTGKFGRTARGVASVTSHWADGTRHLPLGVRPYGPARSLLGCKPNGGPDQAQPTWEVIQEVRAAGIPSV